jgi:transcriptional regulator with XRE-family HTH domain
MARTAALVDSLKRELRARNITYAAVAKRLGMSEASVKRMFSQREFTLSRIDSICEVAGMEFSDLARALAAPDAVISQLTYEQEKEFVDNQKLMLVALLSLNHYSFDEMIQLFELDAAECTRLLARLDRLKFIELMPANRIRLLVSRAFAWIPDGPIQRFFKANGVTDRASTARTSSWCSPTARCRALRWARCSRACARPPASSPPCAPTTPRCPRASARPSRCCSRRGRGCRISCASTGGQ